MTYSNLSKDTQLVRIDSRSFRSQIPGLQWRVGGGGWLVKTEARLGKPAVSCKDNSSFSTGLVNREIN